MCQTVRNQMLLKAIGGADNGLRGVLSKLIAGALVVGKFSVFPIVSVVDLVHFIGQPIDVMDHGKLIVQKQHVDRAGQDDESNNAEEGMAF